MTTPKAVSLVLVVVVACSKKPGHPPAPPVLDNIPQVDAKLAPPPEADKVVIDGVHEATAPKTQTSPYTLLAVAPDVSYAKVVDDVQRLGRGSCLLLVRTPSGVGALPFPLPKMAANVSDEPLLVLTIARSASGGPQLFLGATAVAEPDLERVLRESHRQRLDLLIDNATPAGELAKILASVEAVIPDVRVLIHPEPPVEAPRD
jgi:hypothetical protein